MKKLALITGMGSNAIARATAGSLLQSGYSVTATNEGDFDVDSDLRISFEREFEQYSEVRYEAVDFSSDLSIRDLIARLSLHEYDAIVNCSTVLGLADGKLRNEAFDFDYTEFNRVLQVSVSSVAAVCFGLADRIKRGGAIVNVTSSAAREGGFATISYNASKAAIDNLTKSLANILGPSRNIRVNGLAPGWIPPSSDAAAGGIVGLANALTPSHEIGRPEDAAAAILYLINSRFHNGTILALDGGLSSSYLPYMLETLELRGIPMDSVVHSLSSAIEDAKAKFE